MTVERKTSTEEATKLLIDDPSDFKFHAAYMAYSETWDKISSPETRTELNELLTSLSKEEISYSSFYKTLDEYRTHSSKHYEFSRERIETQRKRDWRQQRNRQERNSRHKGRH
ncbi:MAG TPA: hypothetical protein ENN36_08350 [Candidatus Bathyarchaeota archaeon]|nr:hypothetical protein [Candidatus Bathyarchaeota archaeon]